MNLILQATNLVLTSPLREYVEIEIGLLKKLVGGFGGDNIETRVEVGRISHHHKKGEVFFAEINIRIGKRILRSRSENLSVRAAIDEARDELRNELIKFRGKQTALFKRGARVMGKMLRLSPLARLWRKGRIKDEYL